MDSTLTMLMFQYAFGVPGFITDPVFDTASNALIHFHCTSATKMDGPAGKRLPFSIRTQSDSEQGVALEVENRIGQPVTCAKFVNHDTMLISTGKIFKVTHDELGCRTQFWTEVADARAMFLNWGGGVVKGGVMTLLHRVVFYGDHMQADPRPGHADGHEGGRRRVRCRYTRRGIRWRIDNSNRCAATRRRGTSVRGNAHGNAPDSDRGLARTMLPTLPEDTEYALSDKEVLDLKPRVRQRGYLAKEDLKAVAHWKSPRNAGHVEKNSEDYVAEITQFALTTKCERARVESLTLLDGVSWPTASVILHFFHRDCYPILDVRALWSASGDEPSQYSFEFWWRYVEFCRKTARPLAWTCARWTKRCAVLPKKNQVE